MWKETGTGTLVTVRSPLQARRKRHSYRKTLLHCPSLHTYVPILGVGTASDEANLCKEQVSLESKGLAIRTQSENLFELLCNQLGIQFKAIPCENSQTPDYDLLLNGHRVIAEVKQLEPNDDDKHNQYEGMTTGSAGAWGTTDERWRKRFKKANRQLKARCADGLPGVAIVFDGGTFVGTDSTDIKNAMIGQETVTISRTNCEVVGVSAIYPSRDGCLTTGTNTTINAVALLWTRNEPRLSLFHNHYAANPIHPDWYRHERFRHFRIASNSYEWTEA